MEHSYVITIPCSSRTYVLAGEPTKPTKSLLVDGPGGASWELRTRKGRRSGTELSRPLATGIDSGLHLLRCRGATEEPLRTVTSLLLSACIPFILRAASGALGPAAMGRPRNPTTAARAASSLFSCRPRDALREAVSRAASPPVGARDEGMHTPRRHAASSDAPPRRRRGGWQLNCAGRWHP